ncbi:unnamed protein product [Owenia fusiformis]|uniref:Uncharacterized protein n=1 Tax=Owenia fusiformis TaxID=6347 RepID=A0A8J1Y2Z7_OWEFU|nr:unnamed protein product [Owenia fusiformis]
MRHLESSNSFCGVRQCDLELGLFKIFFYILKSYASLDGNGCSKEYYAVMGVPHGCSLEELKEAYIKLAKRLHPDSRNKDADGAQFAIVENAYRRLQEHIQSEASGENKATEEEGEVIQIKHTVPQHRQYLGYEGVGFGTPTQREKQYQQYKVARAQDTVTDRRIEKHAGQYETAVIVKDKKRSQTHRVKGSINSVVNDLILDAMNRGDFDNLPGAGKPLKHTTYNIGVDSTTHNLNKILVNNGFAPEWVMLQKDIKSEHKKGRKQLCRKRLFLGGLPFTSSQEKLWKGYTDDFRQTIADVNKLIDKFNMIVPSMQWQMFHYKTEPFIKQTLDADLEALAQELGEKIAKFSGNQQECRNFDPGMSGGPGDENAVFKEFYNEIKSWFLNLKTEKKDG